MKTSTTNKVLKFEEDIEEVQLELLNQKDLNDVELRINKIKYEIEDCYMYLKFQDEEVKDMQDQMKNIRNNDVKLLAKQNESFRQAFIRDSLNNKVQYNLYNRLDKYYNEQYQIQNPKIRKLATYAIQVRILDKDPYEPFINPRETVKDIQSKSIVFSVTTDFTFEQLYQKSCLFFKKDPSAYVMTDIYHNNLQILFDIPVAHYFYSEVGQGHCIVFISIANIKITTLLDHQKQALTLDKTRDLELESIIASEKQKKNMLPLVAFFEEFKPGTLSYKVNNDQILLKPRLTAKIYRFLTNVILFFMIFEMNNYFADISILEKTSKGILQHTRKSEEGLNTLQDYLKYYSFQSNIERRKQGTTEAYEEYNPLWQEQSKINKFTPYENNCANIEINYHDSPNQDVQEILQKSLIPLGPVRLIFKLTKENENCKKSTNNPRTCHFIEYSGENIYNTPICTDVEKTNCYEFKEQEQTNVDIMGGSGYILDFKPDNNPCEDTVKKVKLIIDNGILVGQKARAVIYNQNLYDYVNDIYIYVQNVVTHNIDDTISKKYRIASFKIYFGNDVYVKTQSYIIMILFITFFGLEFLMDIAAPLLNKSLSLKYVFSLNNIVNGLLIYIYKMHYYDTIFLLPEGIENREQLLELDPAIFTDLGDNMVNFYFCLQVIGAINIVMFFKVAIQMNFFGYYSELVNILRISSQSIFYSLLLFVVFGISNMYILKYAFGMHEERCNSELKAFNYYIYLIFYTTSYKMDTLSRINFNFAFCIQSFGLFIVYNNFVCLQVAIFTNNKLIRSLNTVKDESYPFSIKVQAFIQYLKDGYNSRKNKLSKWWERRSKKKKKRV